MADLQEHFVGRAPLDLPVHHLPPESLDLSLLVTAFREVMSIKEEAGLPAAIVKPEPYHIEDKMEEIKAALEAHGGRMRFEDAFERGTRNELVLLALLELIKQQSVSVEQAHLFGTIHHCLAGEKMMKENESSRRGELAARRRLKPCCLPRAIRCRFSGIAAVMDCEESEVVELARSLQAKLTSEGSGLTVQKVAGGYQLHAAQRVCDGRAAEPGHRPPPLGADDGDALHHRLQAAHPHPKPEIEQLRGVRVERALAKLLELGLICELGRKQVIGRPILYGTTATFLRCFGLDSLDDLPQLPAEDPAVRLELEAAAAEKGSPAENAKP